MNYTHLQIGWLQFWTAPGGLRTPGISTCESDSLPWNFQPHKRTPPQEFPFFWQNTPGKLYIGLKFSWKINSLTSPPLLEFPSGTRHTSPGKFSIGPQPPWYSLKMQSAMARLKKKEGSFGWGWHLVNILIWLLSISPPNNIRYNKKNYKTLLNIDRKA